MVDAMGREFDQSLESALDADIALDFRLTDAGCSRGCGTDANPELECP